MHCNREEGCDSQESDCEGLHGCACLATRCCSQWGACRKAEVEARERATSRWTLRKSQVQSSGTWCGELCTERTGGRCHSRQRELGHTELMHIGRLCFPVWGARCWDTACADGLAESMQARDTAVRAEPAVCRFSTLRMVPPRGVSGVTALCGASQSDDARCYQQMRDGQKADAPEISLVRVTMPVTG